MSSSAYVAEISSNKAHRRLVLVTSGCLAVAACYCLFLLPIKLEWRLLAAALWLLGNGWQIRKFRRLYLRFSCMQVHAGGKVRLCGDGSGYEEATILPGSVLLAGVGWIRLRTADAGCFAELVSGNTRKSEQWRRLRVIWRHP